MKSSFLIKLAITIVLSIVGLIAFDRLGNMSQHLYFLSISLAMMILIAIAVYLFAMKTIGTKDPNAFTRFSLAHTFFKLLIMVVIVVVYRTQFSTESINFIWPFLMMYIFFTILETSFLLKIARL